VGADRRGPLAAFIIVAVIAGILLVTSVRSQAAPGWLDAVGLPATVAASPVTGGLDQIVREGVVLVHRADTDAVEDDTRIESVGPSTSVATSGTHRSSRRTPHHMGSTHRHHATVMPHHTLSPPHQPTPGAPSAPPPAGQAPPRHDHGRHLGWAEHHGQDDTWDDTADDTADEPPAEAPAEAPGEHQHGNGHAYGHEKHHGHGHGHGNGNGHGHEQHQDED
jgi:hypothetical protein